MSKFIAKTVTLVLILMSLGVVYVLFLIKDLPRPDQFGNRQISQSTKIYDRTGQVLLYEIHGEEKRTIIPFEEIPDSVKFATIAAEDAEFYSQPAFNWRAIIRAVLANLKSGEFSQGGSTITQQLAKNLFLTPEKTISRKIKEIILAIELESQYSKDEILGLYLNQIPYGSNAYGVEAASQTYFGKPAKNLNLAEAAVLASLLKAPSYYSPWGTRQGELFERQAHIISRMTELGFITEEEAEQALAESPNIKFAPPISGIIKAPHFVLTVKDILVSRYGEEVVEKGGLKVITTLDWEIQEAAEQFIKEGAERNDELYAGKNAALVAQDPKTGQVLALVGSRDYYALESLPAGCTPRINCGFEPKFNVPIQGLRQPGSALKPFAYLTAFKKGFSPQTLVFDVPTEFVAGDPDCPSIITPLSKENPECFNPDNFDERFRGPVSLETALAQSINVPSVKTLYLAGFDDVLKTLADFGVSTLKERWRYGLSLVLGGGEVKLVELVNAYATLAQEGVYHRQSFILRVEDADGDVLETYRDETKRVIEPQYPRLVNQILSDIELRSGLFQNSLSLTVFPDYEVALKTGTTNDYRDAWAIGYTPSLVIGVWAGNNDNAQMQRRGSSILAAIPIWHEVMAKALTKYSPEIFTKPEPAPPSPKPMLNGNYIYLPVVENVIKPQIHSILYYLDKNDPLGPAPLDPYRDSQFNNWEAAVLEWIKLNIPFATVYNQPISRPLTFESQIKAGSPQSSPANLSINIKNPKNGEFVGSRFFLEVEVNSPSFPLDWIELYLNRQLLEKRFITGNSLQYSHRLDVISPQNLVEIKVADRAGNANSASVIVFR